jgi:hypothetical protein
MLMGLVIIGSVLLVSCRSGFLEGSNGVAIMEEELVVHWRQEEGVLDVCNELYLYRDGAAQAVAYRGEHRAGVGQGPPP